MEFIVSACTDIGNTKSTNQDSFGARTYNTKIGKVVFAVLCDGMGGLSKGEVASSSLVNAFVKWSETKLPVLIENGIDDYSIRNDWTEIAVTYNEKIKDYGRRSGISLGTTLTAILLTPNRYYIINVGDTRAYEIYQYARVLTKDQTVVARDVELGNITEEEAKVDSRRSVLLQCVGASDAVYPDLFFGDTLPNCVYMLCTDGFRHEISEQEIFEYLRPEVMLSEENMRANMEALISMNKQRQERDNITVLTVRTI